MIRLFVVKDVNIFLQNEDAKMKGFKFESAGSLKLEKQGYVFWFNADEDFFEKDVFKQEGVEELKGEEKEKALKEFERIETEKMSGVGGLF